MWINTFILLAAAARVSGTDCTRIETPVMGDFAPQGLDVRTFSKSLRPGDDFFGYVNEGWIASTPIPEGHWDYGQTTTLGGSVDRQIQSLLDAALEARSSRDLVGQQVADAYASFLNSAAIQKHGLAKLEAELQRILRAGSPEDIARWMAHPTSSSIVAINVYPAERRPRVHLDQQNLTQPMLGLPNSNDYVRTDEAGVRLRDTYRTYVAELLGAAGVPDAVKRAERVLALETSIAGNMWPFEKLRDRKANYHPMTLAELKAYAPGFPWAAFLAARGVGDISELVLGTDTAVRLQMRLFAVLPIEDWKSWLAFHWIQNQIEVLPDDLQRLSWAFYGQALSNAKTRPTRQEGAARLVRSAMGQHLGKLYAQRYVSEKTRATAEEMIVYLRRAFAERLAQASWMDEATQAEAQAKLARMAFKVGYPRIWRDFSGIRIDRKDAAGNLHRLRQSDWNYQRRRLDPDFKDEPWYQTPHTVDASYSVLYNAIELPGAFLQPPYFDAAADPAVNFGAIGAIVGHEMGHGFDDQGIIFDSEGRLRNWWSARSLEAFHLRARALVAQYNAFAPYPDAHVDGERTIGENIADLSGVLLAHRAWQLYLADHPCALLSSRDGLTGDQRFFAAWAQAWRYQAPESAVRHVIRWGFHAPTPYRVNGVMQNIDAWYEAFGIQPGDKLYVAPMRRVRIW